MIELFAYSSWHAERDRITIHHAAEQVTAICFVCVRYATFCALMVYPELSHLSFQINKYVI